MNPESTVVTLVVETGGRFEEVPITNGEITLREFLDQTLKRLEVSYVCTKYSVGPGNRVHPPWGYHGGTCMVLGHVMARQRWDLVKLKVSAEPIQREGQP